MRLRLRADGLGRRYATLRLRGETLHGQSSLMDHECAADGKADNSRSPGYDSEAGGDFEKRLTSVENCDRAAYGDQGGGREETQCGVEKPEGAQEHLSATTERSQLFHPVAMHL